ncbi:C6 transcription factor [Colletotrichum asianum]|uniref:C6 transcription factor n=1 Tax=Colletotrichum asianum TaxID=702518 RepID=A0A8H3WE11_9PEZI|nr:C6 transcription factor [Colletotrichum asianum]
MIFSSIDESDSWISALLDGQGWKPPFRLAGSGPTLVEDGDACEGFVDAWRKTEVLKHIEQWLPVTEPLENDNEGNPDKSFDSRDNQNSTTTDMASPMNTSTTSPARNPSQDTGTIPSTSDSIAQDVENNINSILMATQVFSPLEDTTMRQESLSRPQSGRSELPDNWLAYVLESRDNRSSTADSMSHGDRCSLWAVLAYSSHLSKTEEHSTSAVALHARTMHLLGEKLENRGDKTATWLAAGKATYAAAALLLAPDTTTATQGQLDEGSKRTLACCFRSDLAKVGTLATDSMEEWEPWQMRDGQGLTFHSHHSPGHIISTFNHLVQLAVFLNDLLRLRNQDDENERLRKLDRTLKSWSQQNNPQCQTSSGAEASPQMFNLQLIYGRMEEQCRLLEQRMKSMGTSPTPPTVVILLCWFERSVDSQVRVQNHARMRMQLQALRMSISTTIESYLQTQTPLKDTHESASNLFNDGSMSNSFAQSGGQSTQSAFHLGFATPASSGLSTQSRESNPSIFQGLGDPYNRNSTRNTPMGQSNLLTTQTQGLMSQPPSMGPDMNIDPLLDAASAEMDANELFQSLASLDSADWSTNPPEFMEHLGIPRGIASDLQSFFDKDPGSTFTCSDQKSPRSITMAEFRPALLSASLGRAWLHDFDKKTSSTLQRSSTIPTSRPPTTDHLLAATTHIRKVLDGLKLTVIGLQPFLFYEGLLDREQHARLIEKIKVWFKLAKILGTNTIQIPANFLPAEKLTGDMGVIVGDLVELADLGLKEDPPIRFAYESLCWSTHIDTWGKSWEVACKVDRPNFGLCLDTFNIAGRVWGDPASPTGQTPNADADLKESMERLVRDVDLAKVFYIQVVDAERMESPLVKGHPFHVDGNPARMNWSRNARAYIYETDRGAYLPVEDVARVLIGKLGYKGWISMELFSRTMSEEGEGVPADHARRGIEAWKKFVQRLELNK